MKQLSESPIIAFQALSRILRIKGNARMQEPEPFFALLQRQIQLHAAKGSYQNLMVSFDLSSINKEAQFGFIELMRSLDREPPVPGLIIEWIYQDIAPDWLPKLSTVQMNIIPRWRPGRTA